MRSPRLADYVRDRARPLGAAAMSAVALAWAAFPLLQSPVIPGAIERALANGVGAARLGASDQSLDVDPEQILGVLAQDPIARATRVEYAVAIKSAARRRWKEPAPVLVDGLDPQIASAVRRTFQVLEASTAFRPTPQRRLYAVARRPPAPSGAVAQTVQHALWDGAAATGVSASYLWRTAARESSFDPFAAAPTSSARGLFQFTEASWLAAVARFGSRHGLWAEAAEVRFDNRGRPYVRDAFARARILRLRYDPNIAARLAGETAREHDHLLRRVLGRPATEGELYLAHFLGVDGAARLIRTARLDPWRPAAELFPAAARANRRLFYSNGYAVSCHDLLRRLV